MNEINENEDWLHKLIEQLTEQNRMLQDYAKKHAEASGSIIENLDKLKEAFDQQTNELRKLNGLDPLSL